MTVLEMQQRSRPSIPWTEVCLAAHDRFDSPRAGTRLPAEVPSATRTLDRGRTVPTRTVPTRSVAPGRRVGVRPVSTGQVRACGVETRSGAPVVDDVPTWALVVGGIVFGILMLLALALVGGPTYA